jgi:hypothetical protein
MRKKTEWKIILSCIFPVVIILGCISTPLNDEIIHTGDLILRGDEKMVIEDTQYFQKGNVYIEDQAELVLKNARFMLGRGDVPTIHTYIFVGENASLDIQHSTIFPHEPKFGMGALVVVRTWGRVNITDSDTSIHLLEVIDNGTVTITNSEMVFDIGGLLQVSGGSTKVVDSTLGALGVFVPAHSHLNVRGVKSGMYVESWDIHDIIPDVNYDLVLERTNILEDNLGPGPYERGWIFFIDPQAHARIADCELRKVFIDFLNEEINLDNLKLGVPSDLSYQDIELENITVTGQWGISLTDSEMTIRNSEYLFIQISGHSELMMIDSHMVEFIPRDFYGTMVFENCTWTNAGEIIGGEPYHSMGNNFTIRGSLKLYPELRRHLQWRDAQVRRVYEVFVMDRDGQPVKDISVVVEGESFVTDDDGRAEFTLEFDEKNYDEPIQINIYKEGKTVAEFEVDFFTETPIRITVN